MGMEDRQAALVKAQSSISDIYGKKGLLQLSQEAVVSVRWHSTGFERFTTTLEDKDVPAPSLPRMLETMVGYRD